MSETFFPKNLIKKPEWQGKPCQELRHSQKKAALEKKRNKNMNDKLKCNLKLTQTFEITELK